MSTAGAPPTGSTKNSLLLRWAAAALIALLLYAGLYAVQEALVRKYGRRNPFYKVARAATDRSYLLVLGASHALPLEFQDIRSSVETGLGGPVLVLALPGAGIIPNYVLLDAALRKLSPQRVRAVVYMLDSFGFYSREWNEDRLNDARLWQRAPWDNDLARSVWYATAHLRVTRSVFWNYASGFSKINDPASWRQPDVWPDEGKFDRAYQPDEWKDQTRVAFLYPRGADTEAFDRYLSTFVRLVGDLKAERIPVVVVKPPLRRAFAARLPGELEFNRRIQQTLGRLDAPFHDFADVSFDDSFFYDPDHLNRKGVVRFVSEYLRPALDPHREF